MALCQYRIFLLHKTLNKFGNLNAAVKIEPYIDKLNEEVQLDAIKDLANIYASISLWDKVSELAQELERRVNFQIKFQNKKHKIKRRKSFYPLFVYKAYANLLQANVSEERKQYVQALKHIDIYENIVDEIKDPSKEEQDLIKLLKGWA